MFELANANFVAKRDAYNRNDTDAHKRFLPIQNLEGAELTPRTENLSETIDLLLEYINGTFREAKVIFKGINSKEAVKSCFGKFQNFDGIWVSNRQGLMEDTAPSSISVLKAVVSEVRYQEQVHGKKITVLFDGGVRRGSDAIKALAYGADFTFIG